MMSDRLATLIHHITTLCSPDQLGRTRLAKILWLADVENYRRTGETITRSDDYVKDEYGPRHRDFYPAIDRLKRDGKLVPLPLNMTPVGPRHEYMATSLPDMSDFSADEIATVDRITLAVLKLSAKRASNLTHDGLYDGVNFNERIPVSAGAVVEGDLTPEIMEWAESVFDADSEAAERI